MNLELTPEQQQYRDRVRAFAETRVAPAAAAIDEADRFPLDLMRDAARNGLVGIVLAPESGGAGRDYLSYALAIETIGQASATVAVSLVVANSLVAEPIARFGTDAQRARWLGSIVRGEAFGAFALSEPEAGTDVAHLHTTALAEPGGGSWRLDGQKVWVAVGEVADLLIVFAMAESKTGSGVTAFLVPVDRAGVVRGEPNRALGVRGLGCCNIDLRGVRVAADEVLGTVGGGWDVVRWTLTGGRVGIAAQALGLGQAAVTEAVNHAKTRRSFGQPLATYEAIQWMLVDAATEMEAARLLTYRAATVRHSEHQAAEAAAMAKLYASESASRSTDRAMQVLASAGYTRGSVVERLFRDARAAEIYQGTSEAQRMVISAHVLRGV